MARRQLAKDEQVIGNVLAEVLGRPGAPLVRLVIQTLMKLFRTGPEVRRAIMTAHISSVLGAEHGRAVQRVGGILAAWGDPILPEPAEPIPAAALFVLARGVIGV